MDEIFKISAVILGSLGGGVLIVDAFTKWLGDLWEKRHIQNENKKLDEEMESYKTKLKSRVHFPERFLGGIRAYSIDPKFLPTYSHSQMD